MVLLLGSSRQVLGGGKEKVKGKMSRQVILASVQQVAAMLEM